MMSYLMALQVLQALLWPNYPGLPDYQFRLWYSVSSKNVLASCKTCQNQNHCQIQGNIEDRKVEIYVICEILNIALQATSNFQRATLWRTAWRATISSLPRLRHWWARLAMVAIHPCTLLTSRLLRMSALNLPSRFRNLHRNLNKKYKSLCENGYTMSRQPRLHLL